MRITRVISTEVNKFFQRVVKVLKYGKSDTRTALAAAPYGVDSNPIKGMIAIYSETMTKGKPVIVGYINKNQVADIGELRHFSTDVNGNEVMYLHLLNDSTMEIGGANDNMVRFLELEKAFNEFKTDYNNHITAYNAHVHSGVTTGPGATGPTTPDTPTGADISLAKIDQIKTIGNLVT